MKIAILGGRGYPSTYGGYETLVRVLAPYLVEHGHDVTVYCRRREGNRRSWTRGGVRCVATLGCDTKSLSTLTYGLTSAADAAFRRYDAILVLNIANGYWLPLLRAAGLPCAVNTDGIEWERRKWGRTGRKVFAVAARLTARYATELVCDSRAIGSIWSDRFKREPVFIPYGAPIVARPDTGRLDAIGLDPATPYALAVARLTPENNVDLMLDALEHLGDDAPPAVVVGSANCDSPIEDRLRRMENDGRLRWLGHVADQELLTALWAHSAVYVHGHSVGGTNPALLQALGAGAPTLALDTQFNAEVLRDGNARFPADARVLAGMIRNVVASERAQDAMRRNGRQVIRDGYLWDEVCSSYEELLLELGRRHAHAPARPRQRPAERWGSHSDRAIASAINSVPEVRRVKPGNMRISLRMRQSLAVARVVVRDRREIAHVAPLVRTRGKSTLQVRLPWLPFAVIELLATRINERSNVFAYGGGGSTAWFTDRAGSVTTVEHDPSWHKALATVVGSAGTTDIRYAEVQGPDSAFVRAIDDLADDSLDVVLVDGRERVACIRRAAAKVRPGGLLLLDDAQRQKYSAAEDILSSWAQTRYFGLVPCKDEPGYTSVWERPRRDPAPVGSDA